MVQCGYRGVESGVQPSAMDPGGEQTASGPIPIRDWTDDTRYSSAARGHDFEPVGPSAAPSARARAARPLRRSRRVGDGRLPHKPDGVKRRDHKRERARFGPGDALASDFRPAREFQPRLSRRDVQLRPQRRLGLGKQTDRKALELWSFGTVGFDQQGGQPVDGRCTSIPGIVHRSHQLMPIDVGCTPGNSRRCRLTRTAQSSQQVAAQCFRPRARHPLPRMARPSCLAATQRIHRIERPEFGRRG